ncbi:hypothetical protein BDP27DRAFT_768221 [Rhodocollybia butyracea]|uniref:Uncharacterized protein n=1 Tax=Rhodocollybia butyracea TaxID=206335 RepID=A0A9P5TWL6_9AGAR|nr:hypothetical protein BDP27DRAFT_768221 [Rhodocollybia butyracea]
MVLVSFYWHPRLDTLAVDVFLQLGTPSLSTAFLPAFEYPTTLDVYLTTKTGYLGFLIHQIMSPFCDFQDSYLPRAMRNGPHSQVGLGEVELLVGLQNSNLPSHWPSLC